MGRPQEEEGQVQGGGRAGLGLLAPSPSDDLGPPGRSADQKRALVSLWDVPKWLIVPCFLISGNAR